jgi:hypothetical protein
MRVERDENYGALLRALTVDGAPEVRMPLSHEQLKALHQDAGELLREIAEERDEHFFAHGGQHCWRCGAGDVTWERGGAWCPNCGHEYLPEDERFDDWSSPVAPGLLGSDDMWILDVYQGDPRGRIVTFHGTTKDGHMHRYAAKGLVCASSLGERGTTWKATPEGLEVIRRTDERMSAVAAAEEE